MIKIRERERERENNNSMPLPGAADEEMPSPPPARRRRTVSPPQPTATTSAVSANFEAEEAVAEKDRVRSRLHGPDRLSGADEPHLCGGRRRAESSKTLGCDHYKRKCEFYVSQKVSAILIQLLPRVRRAISMRL